RGLTGTWPVIGLVLMLVLAACSGSAVASAPGSTPAPTGGTGGSSPVPGASESAPPSAGGVPATQGVILTQSWATAELTDVRNGTTFRIADLVASQRVVFIETMAIWCSNCRTQQRDVVKALAGLDPNRVTWIGIDVDGSESPSALADYSASLGFDWPYVVGSADFLRALSAEFGDQVLSPPSTPIIVIGTDGTLTLTEFGHKSVDRITELAAAAGA
ncbi:MAG: hypothetical protein ABI598_07635, partial [Chloroflexota bacterium]